MSDERELFGYQSPDFKAMQEAISEVVAKDGYFMPSEPEIPEEYADIRERIYSVVTDARRFNLPLAGARLHVGREVYDEMRRTLPVAVDWMGSPVRYSGLDVVVEDGASPTMVELRWSIRG